MTGTTTSGMRTNRVKARLRDGDHAFGTWVAAVRSPAVARMIAAAGFDFAFIDTEHSDFSWETVATLCDMARASDIVPIVRPHEQSGPLANRIQDLGAMGLMFHDVTSRQEVDDLLGWMRYPPLGSRGASSHGAAMDYVLAPGSDLKAHINDTTMLVIQIESVSGVERIAEILAPGGVDVVEIGRGDLSTSLGAPHEIRHPRVLETVDRIVAACDRHGVAAGVNCVSLEDAEDMLGRGVRCISYSSDRRILVETYHSVMSELRRLVPAQPAAGRAS